MYLPLLTIILVTSAWPNLADKSITSVLQWKYIDYFWEHPGQQEQYEKNNDYQPSKIIPTNVDQDLDDRIFLSFRSAKGVPVTLGVVTDMYKESAGYLIGAYPNWFWFTPNDCNSIHSVNDMKIDACNRLWVLDLGFPRNKNNHCAPKLLVFDLHTDNLINRYNIPNIDPDHEFYNLVVEIEGPEKYRCDITSVYIIDSVKRKLFVLGKNHGYRLKEEILYSDYLEFYDAIDLDAIVNKVGSSQSYSQKNNLQSLVKEIWQCKGVTFLLKKIRSNKYKIPAFVSFNDRTILFASNKDAAISCWNRHTNYTKIMAQSPVHLRYVESIKAINRWFEDDENLILILSSSFDSNNISMSKVNFEVLAGSTDLMINNARCFLD